MRKTTLILLVVGLVAAGMIAGSALASSGSRAASNTGRAGPTLKAHPAAIVRGARQAVVNADGTLARGRGIVSTAHLGTGAYEVITNTTITNCAFVGNLGIAAFSGTQAPGYLTVAGRAGTTTGVFVDTFDSTGAGADEPFHLAVIC